MLVKAKILPADYWAVAAVPEGSVLRLTIPFLLMASVQNEKGPQKAPLKFAEAPLTERKIRQPQRKN